MSSHNSKHGEEKVELSDGVKQQYSTDWVYRSEYKNHKTKAVAVLVYGETEQDFWIQQRPEDAHKGGYWEIVAGSQSIDHESSEEAAIEEVSEELFQYGESPDQFDLQYLGTIEKDTENPQTIDIYRYHSSRTGFPGSDEIQEGEFIDIEDVPEVTSSRMFTDCTMHVLEKLDYMDNADPKLEELAKELK